MKKILKNSSGLSLVEVMIAAAISVGIAMVVIQVSQNADKSINKVKTDTEYTDFRNFLKSTFSKGGNCAITLNDAGYTVSSGTGSLSSLKLVTGSEWDDSTQQFSEISSTLITVDNSTPIPQFPSWLAKSINILPMINPTTDVNGNVSGTCIMEIELTRKDSSGSKKSFGARDRKFKMNLSCNVSPTDANKIDFCIENSSTTLGFWSLIGSVPTDGIKHDYDVEIGKNLIVKQHIIVESDKNIKKNIKKLNGTLSKIQQIDGYTYKLKDQYVSKNEQIGLIAQEVEKVYPQAIYQTTSGTKAIRYSMLIPVLLDAIKEQQKQIEKQEKLLQKINKRVSKDEIKNHQK